MKFSTRFIDIVVSIRASLVPSLLLLVVAFSGCSDSRPQHEEPTPEEARGSAHPALKAQIPAPAPAPAAEPATGGEPAASPWKPGEAFVVMGLKVKAPEGWLRQKPANRMRKAQFKLPHAENDTFDGELTVIPAFGGMDANIQRWKQQFKEVPEPLINKREVSGMEVSIVQLDGTYLYKARPMDPAETVQPRPDYRVLAAVVQAPGGQVFFKSFGPRATMEKWQEAFTDMVDSFAPAQE
tara:strand:- start:1015 stop:1731 length:717 start_codon:yes stop_codon:yes gene_type:complete